MTLSLFAPCALVVVAVVILRARTRSARTRLAAATAARKRRREISRILTACGVTLPTPNSDRIEQLLCESARDRNP